MDKFENGQLIVEEAPQAPENEAIKAERPTIDEGVARELALKPYREFFNSQWEGDDPDIDLVVNFVRERGDSQDQIMRKLIKLKLKLGGSHGAQLHSFVQHVRTVLAVREALSGGDSKWPN